MQKHEDSVVTVGELLTDNEEFRAAIKMLYLNKPRHKNLLKLAEELSELTTAILQSVNKPGRDYKKTILDEIIDVMMNVQLVEKEFTSAEKVETINRKVTKMLNSKAYLGYVSKTNYHE